MAPRVGNGIPRLDSMTWYQPWGFSHKSKSQNVKMAFRIGAGFEPVSTCLNWYALKDAGRVGSKSTG